MTPSFLVVKVVIISLCKDPATTVNDNLDQFQEYAGYLERYKWELIQDKELKDSVFCARTANEKEHHTNALKQPIHRVLKAITGWIQSERSQATDGPPAGAPTDPRHDPKSAGPTTHSKGKGHATRQLRATIDSDSDEDDDGLDQVAPHSDSDAESLKMAIDEHSGETSRSSRSSKARSHDASVRDKCKESSKDDPSCCVFCGGNTHPPSECPERAHWLSHLPKDMAAGMVLAIANALSHHSHSGLHGNMTLVVLTEVEIGNRPQLLDFDSCGQKTQHLNGKYNQSQNLKAGS
ncbi:hypothetical protein IW261DRAFT_1573795 [Armillaria novae-zelandiae]|uniref:Fungal-type protein kinase domain-containing protein n=1 Tax=Armillaria novae-zelandiae TaxID=153914 RepID=A0AA39NMW1_9AGAR|nr:hypothetical protein IW261DRAFT_1573795 [Armillaria novae-zelandiae]